MNAAPAARRALIDFDVPIAMRDGTVLRAEIVRPETDTPVPVILMRNPYPPAAARQQLDPLRAVSAGFALVVQQCRGTGTSDGTFEPWVWEESDGVDTIAWCAAQPWSTGRVGMMGGSYLGHTQLFAAGGAPPALAAMAPAIVPSAPYGFTYNGGALCLAAALGWARGQAFLKLIREHSRGQNVGSEFMALGGLMGMPPDEFYRTAPLNSLGALAQVFPAFQQWLDHPTNDEWWDSVDVRDRSVIPAIFVTGWWDLFVTGTVREFNRSRHPSSRLIIGPWSHQLNGAAHGEVLYGMVAGSMANDLVGTQLDFLRAHLTGIEQADAAPVRLFVMGANTWRDEQEWPLARARPIRFHLQPDGGLSPSTPPTGAEPLSYTFDPLDPVPTLGGRNLVAGSEGGYITGPWNHAPNDHRRDVLRFTTDPLDDGLELIGEVSASLMAATSAVDTDWTVMLLDVWPDGRAFNVTEGIIRARHHAGTDRCDFIPAGRPTRFEIDMAVTAYLFKPGHRLRVDVSSSNFPRYDRNPGTGGLSADTAEAAFVQAYQTVFVDADRAAWISLPVVAD